MTPVKVKITCAISRAVAVTLLVLMSSGCNKSPQQSRHTQPLPVDTVVENPETFSGSIAVVGRVAKADPGSGAFVLGCEDACVAMPVKYSGTLPKTGSDVIVRGEIKKEPDGRYIFKAENVTAQK